METTTNTDTFTGQACSDCLMFIANGEVPITDPQTGADWSEDEAASWVDNFAFRNLGIYWTIGDDDEDHFSMDWCSTCNSHLGGSRMSVVGWAI